MIVSITITITIIIVSNNSNNDNNNNNNNSNNNNNHSDNDNNNYNENNIVYHIMYHISYMKSLTPLQPQLRLCLLRLHAFGRGLRPKGSQVQTSQALEAAQPCGPGH